MIIYTQASHCLADALRAVFNLVGTHMPDTRVLSGLFSLRMLSGLFSLWLVHIYARHTGALRAVFTSDAPSSSRTNADVDVEVEVVASS